MHSKRSNPRLKDNITQFCFEAIGTKWVIEIKQKLSDLSEKNLLKKILARVEEFDKNYSRFRSDSLITQMSLKKGGYILPDDSKPLFDIYQKLYFLTDGLFTPMIGNVLDQAGYDADYSLIKKKLTVPLAWDKVIKYNFPKLEIKVPVVLDLGAAGKGYLVDIVGELLTENRIKNFCIDAGGDIKNFGELRRVGLENPDNDTEAIGVLEIGNQSICGSAGNRRKWQNFHHIINPKTLKPIKKILSVWVVADSTLVADAISTALFFVDGEVLMEQFNFEYLTVREDYSYQKSAKLQAEIYSSTDI